MTGAFSPPQQVSAGALLSTRISAGYRGGPDVLRDFELAIQPGEVVGLVGESGSGKEHRRPFHPAAAGFEAARLAASSGSRAAI